MRKRLDQRRKGGRIPASISLPLPSGMFADLLAEGLGFFRVFVALDFQIELSRAVRVKRVFAF